MARSPVPGVWHEKRLLPVQRALGLRTPGVSGPGAQNRGWGLSLVSAEGSKLGAGKVGAGAVYRVK